MADKRDPAPPPAAPKPPASPLTKCVQIMVAIVALVAYALNQDGTGGQSSSGLTDLFNEIQGLAGQDVGAHGHGHDAAVNNIAPPPYSAHEEQSSPEKGKKHKKHKKHKAQEAPSLPESAVPGSADVPSDAPHSQPEGDDNDWEVVGAPKKPKKEHTSPDYYSSESAPHTEPADSRPDAAQSQGGVQPADAPGYYSAVSASAVGTMLKKQLQKLVSQHSTLEYYQVWDALESMDGGTGGCPRSDVKDIYSGQCWHTKRKRCGREEVSAEGQCYNREHTWPQSWWGGEEGPATTDIVHIFLADGWVNKMRSNLPLGEVGEVRFRSKSGAKVGACKGHAAARRHGKQWEQGVVKFFNPEKDFGFVERKGGSDVFLHGSHVTGGQPSAGDAVEFRTVPGSKGDAARDAVIQPSCFEPPEEFKGDLARVFFYMSLAYEGLFKCCSFNGVDSAHINAWMEDMLRQWHEGDPVSEKEIKRNQQIYKWQHNRNPFVDHPAWVKRIEDF